MERGVNIGHDVVAAPSEQPLRGRVREKKLALPADGDDSFGGVIENHLVDATQLADPVLVLDALGDVPDEAAEHALALVDDGRDGQLDRKLGSIATESDHFDSAIQNRAFARFQITLQSAHMLRPVPGRNDQLMQRLTEGLFASPAENQFGLPVPVADDPLRIESHHRVESGVDGQPQPRFALARGGIGSFQLFGAVPDAMLVIEIQLVELRVGVLKLLSVSIDLLVALDGRVVRGEEQVQDLQPTCGDEVPVTVEIDLHADAQVVRSAHFAIDDHVAHSAQEVPLVVRLEDEVVRAGFQTSNDVQGIGHGRDQDDRQVPQAQVVFDRAGELIAVHFRHDHIADDQCGPELTDHVQGNAAVGGDDYLISLPLEYVPKVLGLGGTVLSHQN